MVLKIRTSILFGLLLITSSIFAQNEEEKTPVDQKLSFNISAWGYYTLNSDEILEDQVNFKPVASLTFENTYEIGISYLKEVRSTKQPFNPNINLETNNSFLGYYAKFYTGNKKEISFQIGYNKLRKDTEFYDFVTGNYSDDPSEISNQKTKFTLYTEQKWFSISVGYSYNISPQFFIEPQIAYHIVNETQLRYSSSVANSTDLIAYPANQYIANKLQTESYNRYQINVMVTYRFTVIKKQKMPSEGF